MLSKQEKDAFIFGIALGALCVFSVANWSDSERRENAFDVTFINMTMLLLEIILSTCQAWRGREAASWKYMGLAVGQAATAFFYALSTPLGLETPLNRPDREL